MPPPPADADDPLNEVAAARAMRGKARAGAREQVYTRRSVFLRNAIRPSNESCFAASSAALSTAFQEGSIQTRHDPFSNI
jgi:hypothetical protein